jgi:hypothetical protein
LPLMPISASPIAKPLRLVSGLAACLLLALTCQVFCLPLAAWGMTLDTEGKKQPECIPKFRLETFKVTKVRTTSVAYEFRGHFEYLPESSTIACPPPTASGSFAVQGEWSYSFNTAAESGGYYTGSQFKTVTTYLCKCDDDPWLNPNIKCTQIGSHKPMSGWPESRPFTPPLLSQAQRMELVKQAEALAVPEVTIPTKDQSIKGTKSLFQAKVFLPTPTTAASQPQVTFEITEMLWPSPGGPQPLKKTVTAPVHNRYALINVPLKHGQFQVRARISTPVSQKWSKTVNFKLVP